ncbi:MAG: ribonuclease III [Lachnospiraceae bacterium]|nr:ribonuclease III [Lachnospiraceae bacterium]MBQ6258116.1 ribonuclease III [Lachnospiraceae bacterium]
MTNESILSFFDIEEKDIRTYSPLTLAFLGDAVYELVIRTLVVGKGNTSPAKLHKTSSSFEKAAAQSALLDRIEEELTDDEMDFVRRGRNSKPRTMAKNASTKDYLKATGLETLIGYLYIKGDEERLFYLMEKGMEGKEED